MEIIFTIELAVLRATKNEKTFECKHFDKSLKYESWISVSNDILGWFIRCFAWGCVFDSTMFLCCFLKALNYLLYLTPFK